MKLKLVRAPRHGQTDVLIRTSKSLHEFVVGKVIEMPDAEAHEILAGQFGACFSKEGGGGELAQEPVKATTKIVGPTKNARKSSPEDTAMEEATKMVDDYSTKG